MRGLRITLDDTVNMNELPPQSKTGAEKLTGSYLWMKSYLVPVPGWLPGVDFREAVLDPLEGFSFHKGTKMSPHVHYVDDHEIIEVERHGFLGRAYEHGRLNHDVMEILKKIR